MLRSFEELKTIHGSYIKNRATKLEQVEILELSALALRKYISTMNGTFYEFY